jgi:hypothetical protein
MATNIDTYGDNVCDFIDVDFSDADYVDILSDACDIAADEFDAECINEEWIDRTDYAACAARAVANWETAQRDAAEGLGDYLRDLRDDC